MTCSHRLVLVGSLWFGVAGFGSHAQTIHLNAGDIKTSRSAMEATAQPTRDGAGNGLHLVQFDGPIQPEWVDQLKQSGYRIVDYIPENAYLVYGGLSALQSVRARTKHVCWEGAYLASDKIHPRARPAAASSRKAMSGEDDLFAVQLVLDEAVNAETVALLNALAKEPVERNNAFRHYRNIVVRLSPAEVETIAARPDVISIAPYSMPRKHDERQSMIVAGQLTGDSPTAPGYLAWLASKGFTQQQFTSSGLVVDVADSGLDNGTTSPNHFGLYPGANVGLASRVAYARLEGTPNSGSTLQGCDGHGTLNAHIIGGYNDRGDGFPHQDSSGFRYGLGIAPFVKLGSSVVFDTDTFTSPDFEDMLSRAYRDGARISNNSWGASRSSGIYNIDAQSYDALVRDAQPSDSAVPADSNQGMIIVFSAGNDGPDAGTITPPSTAKNVITVGAAENVQAIGGTDGSGVDDSGADSANDIIDFSSRGPCNDGRMKPEIVAPGTHVSGGVAQQVLTTAGTGTALACYDGEGVSGGPDGAIFFPTTQSFYTASSGTSHAAPAVAGGAALLHQYFLNQGWGAPSPAMIKAYLMNSARHLSGVDAGDTLWSNNQGMGMMNLGFAFDGVARVLRDQVPADKFTASGQQRTISGVPVDASKPVRISLSWTDAPGSTAGNAYKNNLNLSVIAGDKIYWGNVFNGAVSIDGGSADARNNSESVFLPAGTTGRVGVIVTAANVNSDGVPNEAPEVDQDYALVIYNVVQQIGGNRPVFAALADQAIVVSNRLSFPVTASDVFDGDPVTLTASNRPAGSEFPATNGNATFIWNDPAPTGTYSVSFHATDQDGTTVKTISITVLPTSLASLELSPASTNLSSAEASGLALDVEANVSWTATTNASWIAITSGSSGSANGPVTYSVATNSGPSRTGTITVSGGGISRIFTVNQFESMPDAETPPGAGTGADPYRVSRLAHLVWMGDTVSSSDGKHYSLQNNIDATATEVWNDRAGFAPIGGADSYQRFQGIFNGNGMTISNLNINRPTQEQVGFFGSTADTAEVNDLGLPGCSVKGLSKVGTLVGWNDGAVSGCFAVGDVEGVGDYVGGLVGWNDGALSGCYARVSVSGAGEVGGLAGLNYDSSSVSDCYATGAVQGGMWIGGLVGWNDSVVSGCYASGSISGTDSVGGLVGINYTNSTVSECYAMGDVTGAGDNVGGLAGKIRENSGVIRCHAAGAVEGRSSVGGLVGDVNEYCNVSDCYATGAVVGEDWVGGLVGWTEGAVSRCYAAGLVTGDGFGVGGFVGTIYGIGAVDNSYWDTQTSGQATSDGGTGKTTEEMKQQATFEGWDFVNVWFIQEHVTYPYLASGAPVSVSHPEVLSDEFFGVRSNRFGFNMFWATGGVVVVEASTNLMTPDWKPLQTNVLGGTPVYYGDSNWTHFIRRYYRIRVP